MKKIKIFLLGMKEFRLDSTTSFNYPEIEIYDKGRDFAHRLTFRIFDK